MNRAAMESLIRRNAEACENATTSKCVCHCGGALHGQAHGAAWISAQLDLIEVSAALRELAELGKLAAVQGDLFAGALSPTCPVPVGKVDHAGP
jgi:hypothetical protein